MKKNDSIFIDWRKNKNWQDFLADLSNYQIYYEGGEIPKGLVVSSRLQLRLGQNLVLYSIPPGPEVCQQIFKEVQPPKVFFVFQLQKEYSGRQFLEKLLGVVKFDLENNGGIGNILKIASALGQRAETIRIGLEYLANKGLLNYQFNGEQELLFYLGSGEDKEGIRELERKVRIFLEETKAFRRYLARASLVKVKEYFIINPKNGK